MHLLPHEAVNLKKMKIISHNLICKSYAGPVRDNGNTAPRYVNGTHTFLFVVISDENWLWAICIIYGMAEEKDNDDV